MEPWEALRPNGPAYTLFGSTTVSGALQVPCQTGKYAIAPLTSTLTFLGYGPTSLAAQASAVNMVIAQSQTPMQNCIPITWGPPADTPRVFTLAPNTFFAAITPQGNPTAPIVIIPCDGM